MARKKLVSTQVDLMIDSGAFSAWRKKEPINLSQYIDYLHLNEQWIDSYINLDVIPGDKGRKPTLAEVEASAAAGWANFLDMEKSGLNPIPVYHYGEKIDCLERMLDHGCDYIGLGGVVGVPQELTCDWLDGVFDFLLGSNGYPVVKLHGFGITSVPILFKYPFYSVDSITWLFVGAFGSILVPPWNGYEYDYTVVPELVTISDRAGSSAVNGARNFDGMGKQAKEYIVKYVESEGFSILKLRQYHLARKWMCGRYFKRVTEVYTPAPFSTTRTLGFFNKTTSQFSAQKGLKHKLRIVLGVGTCNQYSFCLQQDGHRDRLVSYAYLLDDPKMATPTFQQYVETGLTPGSEGLVWEFTDAELESITSKAL